jgi:hypothetical protein
MNAKTANKPGYDKIISHSNRFPVFKEAFGNAERI